MRLCLLGLLVVTRSFALTIEGPTTAVCGEQNIYRILGAAPSGSFRWRIEWTGSKGEAESWEGDDNEVALNLVFADDPGPHSLRLVSAGGADSNRLDIDALAPGTPGFSARTPSVAAIPPPTLPVLSSAELFPNAAVSREQVPPLPSSHVPLPSQEGDPAVISPSPDGMLDLTAASVPQDPDPIPNPFKVRYRAQMQVREVTLQIGLILVGDRPEDAAAVLNGKLYSPGDLFEGLPVVSITPEAIEFRKDKILLRVPVEDRPVTIRLLR